MKGQAEVFAKPGKTIDPTLIPKAIRDAGFSAAEVLMEADGILAQKGQDLFLTVPGLSQVYRLSAGPEVEALSRRVDLFGKEVRITGKLRLAVAGPPPEMTVEQFGPRGK